MRVYGWASLLMGIPLLCFGLAFPLIVLRMMPSLGTCIENIGFPEVGGFVAGFLAGSLGGLMTGAAGGTFVFMGILQVELAAACFFGFRTEKLLIKYFDAATTAVAPGQQATSADREQFAQPDAADGE